MSSSLDLDFATSAVSTAGPDGAVHKYAFHVEPEVENLRGRSCFEARVLAFLLRSWVLLTLNGVTLASCVVGIGGWAAFYYNGAPSDLPLNLLTFGLIFPLSFLIQYSLTRRENTLRELALIKSSSLLLFWGCRDFPPATPGHAANLQHLQRALSVYLIAVRQTMLHKEHSSNVYLALNAVQTRITAMLADTPPPFRLSGIYARIHQVCQALADSTERALVIHHYRSPASFRGYALAFLFFNSLLFAPIFARYSINPQYGMWAGIYCSLLVSVMYAGLYRVLTSEEDPFSGHGIDVMTLEPLTMHATVLR